MADPAPGKIAFELVSPERLLVSGEVDMVVVPGTEGDFGVLPGHAPLISQLRGGVIETHEDGKAAERIFVAGGFAEAGPQGCTVLAEEAFPLADVSLDAARKRLAEAERAAAEARGEAERAAAEGERAAAAALVEAIDHYGTG